jgi:tRNA nucleotidyltransferase (CCA-adding enzyme)
VLTPSTGAEADPAADLEVYLVGGAVRDALLGHPVTERDWVVVGATPEAMVARGFRPVGKDFPVFLHPVTHEEYALARTERKSGRGYRGFIVHAAPDVTLEQDLRRRDLTINAMARAPDGRLIDPYGGYGDLQARRLCHVSDAFVEDPVRVLRVARFAARFAADGFGVAPETRALMTSMVGNREVDHLVPERVWQETRRALEAAAPVRFFQVLGDCGALARLFPEIDRRLRMDACPLPDPLEALALGTPVSDDPRIRFAILLHDLDGVSCHPEATPERGAAAIMALSERLRVPNAFRELALLVARHHGRFPAAPALSAAALVDTLEAVDAYRRPERFEQFLVACRALYGDAHQSRDVDGSPSTVLRQAREAALTADPKALVRQGLKGEAIKHALREWRIAAVRAALTRRTTGAPPRAPGDTR